MKRTVLYHGYAASATAAGHYDILVLRNGILRGIAFSCSGTGSGTNGHYAFQLALNQNSVVNANVNDPNRLETIATARISLPASTAASINTGFMPVNISVMNGDRLTANATYQGGVAAAIYHSCDFYVEEN